MSSDVRDIAQFNIGDVFSVYDGFSKIKIISRWVVNDRVKYQYIDEKGDIECIEEGNLFLSIQLGVRKFLYNDRGGEVDSYGYYSEDIPY